MKKSRNREPENYGKWLAGWMSGGGSLNTGNIKFAWGTAKTIKPATGCGWYACGFIMAQIMCMDIVILRPMPDQNN